jgi:hypothetical protein
MARFLPPVLYTQATVTLWPSNFILSPLYKTGKKTKTGRDDVDELGYPAPVTHVHGRDAVSSSSPLISTWITGNPSLPAELFAATIHSSEL